MQAQNIDDVIERLTEIIDEASRERLRLGYFPALYRRVTLRIRDGIAQGFFDDGPRMERLDVVFAGRYLDALEAWRSGGKPTTSWQAAFDAAGEFWPIVVQHLLLGISAHINLDLGIAAARTAPGAALAPLRADFDRINSILASLVDSVQQELAQVWPLLRFFNRRLGTVDDRIINFSMKRARAFAWNVAEQLAPLPEAAQAERVAELDAQVAKLAERIRHPGIVLGVVTKIVRLGERTSVPETIRILSA